VPLRNLDGSGRLIGKWVNVRSSTGPAAYSPTNTFLYRRDDDRFEQVMAYFWVNQAQEYLQSLGFGRTLRPVNAESQDVRINQLGYDNSFSWDKHDYLRFGKGGVDDAEDAEVIVHEYGHSVQDGQVTGFGVGQDAGAIGEGFSDYLAEEVSRAVAPTADMPCIADWDSISYTVGDPVHCLRRVDGNKVYPDDLRSPREVHADGEIWSRALWDIRNALGSAQANAIIIRAQFGFAVDTSMPAAAAKTIATAGLYGAKAQKAVKTAFAARGLA
jgi:Zn-dependent metalloprotease